jgi:hypothetical protein
MVLDIKQDEWQKVQTKKASSLKNNKQKFKISVQNSYTGLEIEDSQFTSFPEIVEIDEQTKRPSRKCENYTSKSFENQPWKCCNKTPRSSKDK